MHCFVPEIYVVKSRLHRFLVFLLFGATRGKGENRWKNITESREICEAEGKASVKYFCRFDCVSHVWRTRRHDWILQQCLHCQTDSITNVIKRLRFLLEDGSELVLLSNYWDWHDKMVTSLPVMVVLNISNSESLTNKHIKYKVITSTIVCGISR